MFQPQSTPIRYSPPASFTKHGERIAPLSLASIIADRARAYLKRPGVDPELEEIIADLTKKTFCEMEEADAFIASWSDRIAIYDGVASIICVFDKIGARYTCGYYISFETSPEAELHILGFWELKDTDAFAPTDDEDHATA